MKGIKMKFQFEKKYFKISFYVFLTIAAIILFFGFIMNFSSTMDLFRNIIDFILGLFQPFIIAVIFAYFIFRPIRWIENNLYGSQIKRDGLRRVISILTIYIGILIVLGIFLYFTIPRMVKNISDLISGLPMYIDKTNEFFLELDVNARIQDLGLIINLEDFDLLNNLAEYIIDLFNNAQSTVEEIITSLVNSAVGFTSGILDIILAIFIAFYILKDKEAIFKSLQDFFNAFFPSRSVKRGRELLELTNKMFGEYLVGNIIDSTIIGILCFIGLILLDIRYALLIALIIGISNLIPYFGPIFGAIPGILLTLFDSPIKALWIAIFVLVLQQFDGNYLKPKILGDKVGLSPLWVIFAIVIGGGLFGVWGMFLGVPTVAVLRVMLMQAIEKRTQ